jgi:2-polyprenyl-6-methoxyphenol hydroxylase-like FAD-dependent oxidoreductase
VGYVQLLSDFKAEGVSVEESFDRAMAHHAELRRRLRGAERVTPFHTEGEYTFRYHQAAGPRWLLAGDAAGFIDPIFSSGVMVALRSSSLAARAILHAAARGRALAPAEQRRYTRQTKKMTNAFLNMIRMFYDRDAFEVFMQPAPFLDLPRGVLNLVGGNTDLPWNLRWRTWIFFAICRLQRYKAITPRLSFNETSTPRPENSRSQPAACPPTA